MFNICVEFIGSFFHYLYIFGIIILKGSFYVGLTIAQTVFYICDIISDILSAIYIIGEEFYRFVCDIENDTADVIDYVHHSTNDGFNWFIEILQIFLRHAKNFLGNTKLHSKLLATRTGSFFNQTFLTIRNSLVLIVECLWESIIFIPKLLTIWLIHIGDCMVIIITAIRIIIITLITDAMFLGALAFMIASLLTLWAKKATILFHIKRMYVKCCIKIGILIHNWFNWSPSPSPLSLSSMTTLQRTWSLLNASSASTSQLMNRNCHDSRIILQQLCVICQDCLKCVVLLPCKHLCLCEECFHLMLLENQQICPLCRRDIQQYLFVYT